jgi:hypothetical protein
MIFAASDINAKGFLHPEQEKEDAACYLKAWHIQPEQIKNHRIEKKEDIHESPGDSDRNKCLPVDLFGCLTCSHRGKDGDTQKWIKNDEEGGERVKDAGKEFLHNL